jgi:uncharacterized protein YqgV (UPF0045/DUF77 family)
MKMKGNLMQLTVEISMYPFNEDYKPLIKGFIAQLNKCEGLIIKTSETSTMVHGEYDRLMDSVKEMIAWSYQTHGRAVFVTKFIPGHDLND